MSLYEKIEKQYRDNKLCGVQFSIDPECYDADVANDRVVFGKNTTEHVSGAEINYQPIIVDGKELGFLMEQISYSFFYPILVSFCVKIADCQDDDFESVREANMNNEHFYDGDESAVLRFATLRQFLDYYHIK